MFNRPRPSLLAATAPITSGLFNVTSFTAAAIMTQDVRKPSNRVSGLYGIGDGPFSFAARAGTYRVRMVNRKPDGTVFTYQFQQLTKRGTPIKGKTFTATPQQTEALGITKL